MDVHDKLDELITLVEDARSMPMSASCIVNRGEVLGLLEELRALLPEEFRHAQLLLADRESVVDEGRREAARILDNAQEQRVALTAETEVVAEAERVAGQIRTAAAEEARTMRAVVDDYVDTKLANFEVVLEKTLNAVHRGRDKLSGQGAGADLGSIEDRPLEPHPFDDGGQDFGPAGSLG